MPFMSCPRCQHRDHASGVETLPCTRAEHCPGIMVPVTYEPGKTLQGPPPVAAASSPACGAPPELYGEGKTPGAKITGLPLESIPTPLVIELERQLAPALGERNALLGARRMLASLLAAVHRDTRYVELHGWDKATADAETIIRELHRDPKPDNIPDAVQAHQVGSEAEGIRVAAGGALDAIGCRLGVFRPDGETDADYRPRLLRAVTQPVLQPVAAAPPTSRALEVIADMREVAELCSSGAGYGDEVRPLTVLGTLAALERRLTEAG